MTVLLSRVHADRDSTFLVYGNLQEDLSARNLSG